MRSLEDLIDYQEGREEIPYFQVGKGEQMRLPKSLMNSGMSLGQLEELIEKDQTHFLIIGGIEVFLPHSLVEAQAYVVDAIAAGEGQPVVTVKEEEVEKTSKSTPIGEEHGDKILTPWELELEMLEESLSHLETVDGYREQTVMQMLIEEYSEEFLENFSQGSEQMMMTAMSRHAVVDEGKFRSKE
jgi:hypothetical protein